MTTVLDPDSRIAVAQTEPYNTMGARWAVARVGPFPTKAEAKQAASTMLAAYTGQEATE